MKIITLFCKIDDFFLAYEKWQTTHCLPETTPPETRGRSATASERSDDELRSIKVGIGRSSIFTKDTSGLLVRRVSTSGEFSVRSTQERGATLLTIYLQPTSVNVAVSPSLLDTVAVQ